LQCEPERRLPFRDRLLRRWLHGAPADRATFFALAAGTDHADNFSYV
jgi:hypothetical protein